MSNDTDEVVAALVAMYRAVHRKGEQGQRHGEPGRGPDREGDNEGRGFSLANRARDRLQGRARSGRSL